MSKEGNDPILDQAISGIRNESIDPEAVKAAADRVWARLAAEAPACADYQALLPEWREGRLSPARALLLQDHLHECPACRNAAAGPRKPVVAMHAPARRAAPVWKWALAASLVAAAAAGAWMVADRLGVPDGPRATVAAADGTLYRVASAGRTALAPGAPIAEDEDVRTAMGSGAVIRLRDGSLVEMRERTQLAVTERRGGATVRLASGSIIVQAAKQRSKHLYVATPDCLVSVTGTIFSVNRGMKGSRVAVVEGEVRVAHAGSTEVLHPGDQTATSASLTPVPVNAEIAWSRDADRYAAVLAELTKFSRKIEALPGPGLRHGTRLLDLAPAGTVFYAAIPNIGPTVGEASRIFQEQLSQSEPLRQWWTEKMQSPEGEAKFNEALARIQTLGAYLGPEIAVAFTQGAQSPVVMAEVAKPGLRDFIEKQIDGKPVRVIDDPLAAAPAAGVEAWIWVGPNLVAAAKQLPALQAIASGRTGFAGTPFHARIAQAYTNGVAWLLCGDMHALVAGKTPNATGFADAQYLVVERKEIAGQTENRAVLSFAQARRGIASWLAAPAPVRALDFVSADATLATAALVKDPALLIDDVLAMAPGEEAARHLSEFEAQTGVNLREDLARPLGGEFAFAIDGPMLPVPSWKLVLEVSDPARFEQALEKLPQIRIVKEQAGGRTFHTLTGTKLPFDPQFIYEDGFLIAAPNRDLLLRALEYRTAGNTLVASAQFKALLPRDGHTNFSAMAYHKLGTALAPLVNNIVLTPEQRQAAAAAAAGAPPTLVLAYGEQDRIELASAGTFFGLRLQQLLGLGGAHAAHAPKHQH
ncbi:MAG: FecR domain-containing protein [Acidobacteriota bacterium]